MRGQFRGVVISIGQVHVCLYKFHFYMYHFFVPSSSHQMVTLSLQLYSIIPSLPHWVGWIYWISHGLLGKGHHPLPVHQQYCAGSWEG